ncbi:MAG: hypothetical protein KGJ59_04650 [Bacteroidota bacterium]|nr:hypothetical protein [Bacteroidota bacterium]
MGKNVLPAIAVVFALSSPLFGQTSLNSENAVERSPLSISITGGASFNVLTNGIFNNWGNGWTAGAGLMYAPIRSVSVIGNVSYSRHPFQGGNINLIVPAVVGWNERVIGSDPLTILEASGGIRFTPPRLKYATPFLSLTGGVYRLSVGKVIVESWMDSQPQDVSRWTYNGTGIVTTRSFASLGFGFVVPVTSAFNIQLEQQLTQTLDYDVSFLRSIASVEMKL